MPDLFPMRALKKREIPLPLREIPNPPHALYVRGTLPHKSFIRLAVIGSRQCTPYGEHATKYLIKGLEGFPVAIVSGLALGIDAIAHEAALEAKLPIIAIPGSGLDDSVLYPRINFPLAQKILESGGCLLSEFEPLFKATPYSFPQRNRIMAGISTAVLVIEAETKSGTLITARLATDYNRDVYAVPGSIFSKTSEGTSLLLRLGAIPISSPEDILDALGIEQKEEAI